MLSYLGKPGEGKLSKVGCVPVSRGNTLISTTGSKAYVTGDERSQLHADIALPGGLNPANRKSYPDQPHPYTALLLN